MYCPRCATHNTDDTKYCRSCGANLSLVPQALTGRLRDRSSRRRRRHRDDEDGPPSLENGITKAFMGVAFLLVSAGVAFYAPAGRIWWFWMLIPAFALLGKGVAEIISVTYGSGSNRRSSQTDMASGISTGELPPRSDAVFAPPSVTEQTTRQLDPKTDPYRYRDTDKG